MLASRITATSNAIYTSENVMAWNVLPPCIAVLGAIVMIVSVNPLMAAGLMAASAILSLILLPAGEARFGPASQFRVEGGVRRRRTRRRDRQHGARARVRHDRFASRNASARP